ncbi:MAG: hypothetical protein J9259_01465 [Thermoplasmata archaeon YP2-bin.285]|uniref:Uncharacterized protein n=2 Tax=Candidatus Sysuiplasma superficiale TaxID=2823368 RepID=A0A8J7YS65_9ARCH|nr:hypothetical protein [Candidatus Sysuiplasma superficiale]
MHNECGCCCGCWNEEERPMHHMHGGRHRNARDIVSELEEYKQELENQIVDLQKYIDTVRGPKESSANE